MTEPNSPPPGPPAKNMADIARLFLDGARPTPPNGTPQRIPPHSRTRTTPPAVAAAAPTPFNHRSKIDAPPEAPAPLQAPSPIENQKSKIKNELPSLMLALTGKPSTPPSPQRLIAAAAALAHDHNTTVCVLDLQRDAFTLDIVGLGEGTGGGGETVADLPAIHFSAGLPDVQIAHTLFTYRHAAKHWIIASPDPDHPAFATLAAAIHDWLLVTTTDNESVIASYHQLKRAMIAHAPVPGKNPAALLLSTDYADAALIHSRLRRASNEFLHRDLPLAAVARNFSASSLRLAAISLNHNQCAGGDDSAAMWSIILDELCGVSSEESLSEPEREIPPATVNEALAHATQAAAAASDHVLAAAAAAQVLFDHLSNVLDPEEREALAADLYDSPMPVAPPAPPAAPHYDIRTQIAQPSHNEPAACAIENRKSKIENPGALRAFDVPTDSPLTRTLQWHSVERSIPDLISDSILLDAKPPMAWATESSLTFAPNGNGTGGGTTGTLHVWTLYKDGVSWFALREWASEHRKILALTRRDLAIQTDAPIAIHIVLPLDADSVQSTTLLRTPAENLHLYRLRTLQWNARQGLIVIPIA